MTTLIRGGRVIDPANRVDAVLDLMIEDGKVVRLGEHLQGGTQVIDAAGKIVSPGFIDIHMHEDPVDAQGVPVPCIFETMLRMGVTTVLGGNCGLNVCDPVAYLDQVDRHGAPVNVALLAGHEYFRVAAGATDKYAPATEAQKRAMEEGIRAALAGGCLGVSFGLRYVPGVDEDEFRRAARCCQPGKRLMAAHVRDDADAVLDAVEEVACMGAELEIPVQISHVGSMGGFGQMESLLKRTDAWRMNGLDIAMDCYPYLAFSTRIGETTYDDGWLERYHCDYGVLEFCEGPYKGQRATAQSFAEMRRDFPDCITVCHVMRREDVQRAFLHPGTMVASDGLLDGGQGHPRAAGTFPRFLANFARKGLMDWSTAIARMTALPAERLKLPCKGRMNVGADADVTIFDPAKIRDRATFDAPALPPEGIEVVLVGGTVAVRGGEIIQGHCGRAVRAK